MGVFMRETASARLSRLLALVPWLEQHAGVSISEAAEHFGIGAEELEQDLWLTICCGLPGHGPDQLIDIQFWDDDGSIHVIDAQTLDRPLRLRPAEGMSLLVGLRMLAQVPGDHDRAALASATAKLEAAADVSQAAAVVLDDPGEATATDLARAIRERRPTRLVYAGASRDEVTERVVEPAEIVRHSGRSYLAAWCRSAGSQRTFRLDRIRSVDVLDEILSEEGGRAATPADVAPRQGVVVRVRVWPRSRWLLEALDPEAVRPGGAAKPPLSGSTSTDDAQEATLVVADPAWLVRLVVGQGGGVEVLDPAEVRMQVRDAAVAGLTRMGA
jgi:proteasome accessory factor C